MALSIFRFSAFQINKNVINRLSLCGLRYMSTSTAKDNDTSNIPEPPKRPPTSYILFLTSKREEVKNKHPGIGNLELVKMVGKMWRELEKKEKEKYKKSSEKEREKYNKEYNNFLAKMTEEEKIQFQNSVLTFKRERRAKNEYKKYQRKANTLGRPKINRSGYSLYAEEYCNEHKGKPGYKAVPAMVAAAKSWNQLPADKKEKYTREANEIRHQGQERLSQWVQQMVLDGNYDVVRRSEVKQELINLGQPRKPQNAYNLFTLEFMKERNEEPMQQFQKKCSERWKKLPKDIKQLYKEDYLNKVELYKQAVENWESQMDEDDLLTFVKEAEKLLKTKSKFAPTKKSVSKELAKKATKSKRGRRKKVVVEDDKEMLKPKQVKEKKKAAKKAEESNEWFEE